MDALLNLVGIFKNEVGNIRRTLESAKPHVDGSCILDTGSNDGTQEIIRALHQELSVPGYLYEEPFIDYATTRNRVLDLHRDSNITAVFTLMLSADEILVVEGDKLREFLEAKRGASEGAYAVWVVEKRGNSDNRFLQCRVLRTSAGWRYVGDVHEIPEGPNKERIGPVIPGVEIVFRESDRARKLKRMREYDLPRLRARATIKGADPGELAQARWFLAMTNEALSGACEKDSLEWSEHLFAAMLLYNQCAVAYAISISEMEKALAGQLADDRRNVLVNALPRERAKAGFAYLLSLKAAERLSFLYSAEELFERAETAVQLNARAPEAYFFLAAVAMRVDARQGLLIGDEGAQVARAAKAAIAEGDTAFYISNDSNMEWRCLHVAAECAVALASDENEPLGKRRSFARQAKEFAERAVAAGAPREVFAQLLDMKVA